MTDHTWKIVKWPHSNCFLSLVVCYTHIVIKFIILASFDIFYLLLTLFNQWAINTMDIPLNIKPNMKSVSYLRMFLWLSSIKKREPSKAVISCWVSVVYSTCEICLHVKKDPPWQWLYYYCFLTIGLWTAWRLTTNRP